MFDHLLLSVSNLQRSITFDDAVIALLGSKRLFNLPYVAAHSAVSHPNFWIGNRTEFSYIEPAKGFHLAFSASYRVFVDGLYTTAMDLDGQDSG